MVEKCDGCGLADIEFVLVNDGVEDKYCMECLEEAVMDIIFYKNKTDFKIKECDEDAAEIEVKSQKVIFKNDG